MTAPDAGLTERLTEDERQSLLEDDLALANLHSDWGQRALFTAVERILTARVADAGVRVLREAAGDMEMFEPFPGEEPDWLRDRADRLAEGVRSAAEYREAHDRIVRADALREVAAEWRDAYPMCDTYAHSRFFASELDLRADRLAAHTDDE